MSTALGRDAVPSPPVLSASLEAEVLALAGVDAGALAALGEAARGTRRPLHLPIEHVEVCDAGPVDGLPPGLGVAFALPAGGTRRRFAPSSCGRVDACSASLAGVRCFS